MMELVYQISQGMRKLVPTFELQKKGYMCDVYRERDVVGGVCLLGFILFGLAKEIGVWKQG